MLNVTHSNCATYDGHLQEIIFVSLRGDTTLALLHVFASISSQDTLEHTSITGFVPLTKHGKVNE